MQNVIRREITINASKQKVYDAIANPDLVIKWFPNEIEGEYAVGQRPIFVFTDHGKNQLYIVDAKPYEYFAYRWIPGDIQFLGDVLEEGNTLVEFTIQEKSDGSCVVTLTETGFAHLPAEVAESSFNQNSGGWDFMLGRLETYFKGS